MIVGLIEFLLVVGAVLALALFELVPYYRTKRRLRERDEGR